MAKVELTINGKNHCFEVEDRTLLVNLIRDHAQLTGTHVGCDTSQCGACTVHMNGEAVKSCTVFALQANGRKSPPLKDWRKMENCIPYNKPSHNAMPYSVVFVRQA